MKHVEKITPLTAAASAIATLICCVPLGFAAAAATASLSAVAMTYRPWFLGASIILLIVGAVQVTRLRRNCPMRGTGSFAILGVSALTVLLVIFFPQLMASILADWLP
jgi:hypothetical protein